MLYEVIAPWPLIRKICSQGSHLPPAPSPWYCSTTSSLSPASGEGHHQQCIGSAAPRWGHLVMASGAPLPPLTPVLFCLSQVIPAMLASRSLTSPCLRLLFLLPWSALPRALPLEGSAGEVCTLVLLSGILIPSYSCPTPSPGFHWPSPPAFTLSFLTILGWGLATS